MGERAGRMDASQVARRGRQVLPGFRKPTGGVVTLARSALEQWRQKARLRQRAAIVIPPFDASIRSRKVYFLAPDYPTPSGGVRVLYRHADILNAAGIPALILHQQAGFRCAWFENSTPVAAAASVQLGPDDLLVVSELDVDLLDRLAPEARYIIFNQNTHLTWQRASIAPTPPQAMFTVSDHNARMLSFAYPHHTVERLRLGINATLFHPGSDHRPRRITYMPRRGAGDADQVLAMLRGRDALQGWDVVPLRDLSHEQVAAQMQSSRIYLAFTYQEGFGLPAAEAMAAGNYVIGYSGFGGEEFFRPEFSAAIALGDVMAFAQAVEAAIAHETTTPGWCRERGQAASGLVLANYPREQEAREVAALYRKYLYASPGAP